MTEVQIVVAALARAAKSRQELNCCLTVHMRKTPCQSLGKIVSSKLSNMKKQSKWRKRPLTSCLFSPPLFKKSGDKTVNKINIKKALAKSMAIFMQKRSEMSSRHSFLKRDDFRVHAAASVRDFKRR
jgi:hypothetical protein